MTIQDVAKILQALREAGQLTPSIEKVIIEVTTSLAATDS